MPNGSASLLTIAMIAICSLMLLRNKGRSRLGLNRNNASGMLVDDASTNEDLQSGRARSATHIFPRWRVTLLATPKPRRSIGIVCSKSIICMPFRVTKIYIVYPGFHLFVL